MYKKILKELSIEYEKKRDRHKREQAIRREKVYRDIPAIKRIDEEIFKAGISMSKNILGNPGNYEKTVKKAKDTIEKLRMEKAYLMTESNIPMDYMDIKYDCPICEDRGYLEDGSRCNCLKQAIVSRTYKMSNMEKMLQKENFQTFNIDVFKDEPFENESLTPRQNMIEIAGMAEGFINNFDEDNGENLLFYGTTGLGKTFLSNCIAKSLLDKNKIVIYQTAFTILEIIESHRFRRNSSGFDDNQYNLLFEADLLIIDDLGTEVANTFTNAEIFNIVNTRILGSKKTIVSTNLTPKEISEIYTDRVFSRILDKFIPLKFYGHDLRFEH
ncbi:MAG: ATP-binding protein [Tissierellaceae bacterium]|nr:ATP-binding protein [Tissierellaceae bacterium]